MPKTYPPAAQQKAFELFLTGISPEEVIRRMRRDYGYAAYSVETLRRWVEDKGWEQARDKVRSQAAERVLDTSVEALEASLLQDLMSWKERLQTALDDEGQRTNFTENMGLLLRVHALIDRAVSRRSGAAPVDKPALWLEFFEELVGDLAEIDPNALGALEPHLDELQRRAKQRFQEAA